MPGSREGRSTKGFTMQELEDINNISPCIRTGYLRPVKDVEEFVYNQLGIEDWKDILMPEQIENILLNPTVDGLNRLLSITDSLYFERIYGMYVGLINADAPITSNVSKLMQARYNEFKAGKRNTSIKVSSSVAEKKEFISKAAQDKIDSLEKQLAEMKTMFDAMMNRESLTPTPVTDLAEAKPTPTKRTSTKSKKG